MKKVKKILLLGIVFVICLCNFSFALSHRDWSGDENEPYIEINDNIPSFTSAEKKRTDYFIELSPLDKLGRTGVTFMNIQKDKLPKSDRESISAVYPSGWKYKGKSNNNKYTGIVSGGYIFNRCHQLGFQFSALNAEKKNLFTGTRYININGQLPFEDDVTNYVKKTGNHCLYRCTPIFEGDNLICEGVQLEGWSVEDNGEGICFNVFCYNVQPKIFLDYATGRNWKEGEQPDEFKEMSYESKSSSAKSIKAQIYENEYEGYGDEEDEEDLKDIKESSSKKTKKSKDVSGAAAGGGMGTALILIFLIWFFIFRDDGNNGNNGNQGTSSNYTNFSTKNNFGRDMNQSNKNYWGF